MSGLFYNTGQTFQLYSIGDGPYMASVLNAVAMLSNSNVLVTLGALGLALGLIMTGFRAVGSGLERTGIPMLFVSFLVFVLMFGMRANVVVNDLSDAPGTPYGAVYPVDNIPFGLAFIGHFISSAGLYLTEDMEQAFSVPGQTDPNGLLGFGRSLEMLDAVRMWNHPGLGVGAENIAITNSLRNQASYISNCTMAGVKLDQIDYSLAQTAPDPWVMGSLSTGGLGFNNNFITFPYIAGNGVESDLPCGTGFNDVAVDANPAKSATIFQAFLQALPGAAPNGSFAANGIDAETQVVDAANLVGLSQTQLMQYAGSASTAAAEQIVQASGGSATPADIMAAVMFQQAQQQRDTQWAADESMFRSVARPMTAFFESLIYAVAPFMALLIGFGAWGLQMVLRYCILTIWVMLWLPVMAICNLFEVTIAKQGIAALTNPALQAQLGNGAAPFGSIAGTLHLQQEVENWISVGALLAASTPAITLMLIFGGAMTATNLASRLNTGQNVNEKEVSPDAVHPGAALDVQPLQTRSPMTGQTETGAAAVMDSYSSSYVRNQMMQSRHDAMSSAAVDFTAAQGSVLQAAFTNERGFSTAVQHTDQVAGSAAQTNLATWAKGHVSSLAHASTQSITQLAALNASGGVTAMADELGKEGSPLAAGLGLKGTVSSQMATQLATSFSNALSHEVHQNGSFQATVNTAVSDGITNLAHHSYAFRSALQHSSSVQAAQKQVESTANAFREMAGKTSGFTIAQNTNAAVVGAKLGEANGRRALFEMRHIDPAAVERASAALRALGDRVTGTPAVGSAQWDGTVAVMAASGKYSSPGSESAGTEVARSNLFASLLVQSGAAAAPNLFKGDGSAPSSANSFSGVGDKANAARGTEAKVARHLHDGVPMSTPQDVKGSTVSGLNGQNAGNDAATGAAATGSTQVLAANAGGLAIAGQSEINGVGHAPGQTAIGAIAKQKDVELQQRVAAITRETARAAADGSVFGNDQNLTQMFTSTFNDMKGRVEGNGGAAFDGMMQFTKYFGPGGSLSSPAMRSTARGLLAVDNNLPMGADGVVAEGALQTANAAFANATNPATQSVTNSVMGQNLAAIKQQYPSMSDNAQYVVAAMQTMHTQRGITPQMYKQYVQAWDGTSQGEKNALKEVGWAGGSLQTSAIPPSQLNALLNGRGSDNSRSATDNLDAADKKLDDGNLNLQDIPNYQR